MEHLSTFGNQLSDESDKYVSASAATTVVRKTTTSKSEHRSSNSSVGTLRRQSNEPNHQLSTNKHANEQHQPKTSMRQTTIVNPLSYAHFNNNRNGQQVLLTSGDIEAMTMKQFQMGSLGC